jgi:hypothetical protein
MFDQSSRYAAAVTSLLTGPGGSQIAVVIPPLPARPAVAGYHQRRDGERLDLIAAQYLTDATATWRLCDANNSMVPDALGARSFIGIPAAGR